jgi:hypothetical protein
MATGIEDALKAFLLSSFGGVKKLFEAKTTPSAFIRTEFISIIELTLHEGLCMRARKEISIILIVPQPATRT